MQQTVNEVYAPLFKKKPRYFILMGGRGAGRSTVASQFVNAKLMSDEYFRCALMRLVLNDIRNSIYREVIDRAEENETLEELGVNDGTMTISYGGNTANAVGFRKSSGERRSKLKSLANYNVVVIEEADEIPEADFMQLDDTLRTLKGDIIIIMLLNPPPRTHWIVKRFFDLLPSGVKDFYIPKLKEGLDDTVFIHTNYKDNAKNLSRQTIQNYERYKTTNPDHYYSMVAGLVPEVVRGKIYSGWTQIDAVPHEARLVRHCLDFGYTNDPTALIDIYEYNGGFIFDEVEYKSGMKNNDISAVLLNLPSALTIADCSEPKSIDEIKGAGISILPSEKGADSVANGIQLVQQQRCSVTKRSKNLWNEYENYAWFEDKDGTRLNEPKPGYDHGMDALRYGITSIVRPAKAGVSIHKPVHGGFRRRR